MMFESLNQTYNYFNKLSPEFNYIKVDNSEFTKLHNLFIKNFFRELDEDNKNDDYWDLFKSSLFNYYSCVSKYPISFNNQDLVSNLNLQNLRNSLTDCRDVYPNLSELINDILSKLNDLQNLNINPYAEVINRIVMDNFGKSFALILTTANNLGYDLAINGSKENNIDKRVNIIKETDFIRDDLKHYDYIFLLGGFMHYNFRLLLKNNFSKINILNFPFYSQQNINKYINFKNYVWERKIIEIADIEKSEIEIQTTYDEIKIINNLEIFEENFLFKQILKSINTGQALNEEKYDARACLLANNHACFLTDHEGFDEKQDIFDLSNPDEPIYIQGKKVSTIEVGDFVVLKEGGGSGSDIIIELANKKLGSKANYYRGQKRLWKEYLQRFIQLNTLEIAKKKMKKLEINFQSYWLKEDNIKLKDKNQFLKLIELIEFPISRRGALWDDLDKIDRAHKSAGSDISNILKEKIMSEDIDLLISDGYKHYVIPNSQAKMGVYKIIKISSDKKKIWRSKLDKPFNQKEIGIL